ncbi:MAG: single-stranded DNA-binding protein [Eubacteriales bacterium]|nr:single-stranded DNA-binding protein [Clostridiales bacterium]MDY5836997.1 single-stranded DNA-binding protein [Eubacteriales bacterium]
MNKAILMGRLTKEPELRTTSNNVSVCSFTVAVDRRFKNAQGERETDFIPVVCWRQTADFVARYFQKGQRIALVGSIQVRSWDDEHGKRNWMTEVVADEVYFADSKSDNSYANQAGGQNFNRNQAYSKNPAPEQAPAKQDPIPEGDGFLPVEDDSDAYLPFDL